MRVFVCACVCVCLHARTSKRACSSCVHEYTCMKLHTRAKCVCLCVHVFVYVCVCVCMCLCMFTWTHSLRSCVYRCTSTCTHSLRSYVCVYCTQTPVRAVIRVFLLQLIVCVFKLVAQLRANKGNCSIDIELLQVRPNREFR